MSNTLPTHKDLAVVEEKVLGAPDATTTAQLWGLFQEQQATIATLTAAVNGKAAQDAVSSISQRVTTLTATVGQKADTATMEQRFQTVSGIDASQADALTQLAQQLSTGLAEDKGQLQGILATLTTVNNLLAGLRTDVELKAPSSSVSNLSGQVTTLRNTVNDAATGLAAVYGLAANALPLTGGTLSGPLNVMAPATASNPLQLSSLPLSMTINQALPLITLGSAYSFTVNVTNAAVGQVVILNMQQTLLNNLNFYSAVVTSAGVVTVTLKAGISIAAGSQTFYLRVLR